MGQDYGIPKLGAGFTATDQASAPKNAQAGYIVKLNGDGCVDSSLLPTTCFQRKLLGTNEGEVVGDKPDLTFNNVTIGNYYSIYGWLYFTALQPDAAARVRYRSLGAWDGWEANYTFAYPAGGAFGVWRASTYGVSIGPFEATGTQLIFSIDQLTGASTELQGGLIDESTQMTLVEHPYPMEQVTKWT